MLHGNISSPAAAVCHTKFTFAAGPRDVKQGSFDGMEEALRLPIVVASLAGAGAHAGSFAFNPIATRVAATGFRPDAAP